MATRIYQSGVARIAKLGKRSDTSSIEFEASTPVNFTNATVSGLSLPAGSITGLQADFDAKFAAKTTDDLAEGTTNVYFTVTRFMVGVGNISTSNLAEGSNLYYTQSRFDSALAGKSTTNLAEGSNLYYTQTRFDDALGGKSTSNLAEGSNLYHTSTRARTATYVPCASYTASADTSFGSSAVVVDFDGSVISNAQFENLTGGVFGVPSACVILVSYKLIVNNAVGNVEEDEEAKAVLQISTDTGTTWNDIAHSSVYQSLRVDRKNTLAEELVVNIAQASQLRLRVIRSAGVGNLVATNQVIKFEQRPLAS